jgi:polar amino acid transport system substrate-binding protein
MVASTVTVTEERKKNYSFSIPYFREELHVLYAGSQPPNLKVASQGPRVACQLGSTMELWLRQNAPACTIIVLDSNVQAVEALKAGQVSAVVVDCCQARSFCERNRQLKSAFLASSNEGYAVAFKKNSPLVKDVDKVLQKLEADGTLSHLKKHWGLQ